jgi:dCMP deaminase
MERISWNEYFAQMAKLIALRSPCNRLHVGCVIVKDNIVCSVGYNGFLRSAPHESIIEDNHELATCHAESNTVANACRTGANLMDSTAYITHYPCINCFKLLASAGIKEIIYLEDYRNSPHVATLAQYTNVDIKKYSSI